MSKQSLSIDIIHDDKGTKHILDGVEIHLDNLVDHINYLSEPKPEPLDLEDRIKAAYPDKDVVIVKLSSNYHFKNDKTGFFHDIEIAMYRRIIEGIVSGIEVIE